MLTRTSDGSIMISSAFVVFIDLHDLYLPCGLNTCIKLFYTCLQCMII